METMTPTAAGIPRPGLTVHAKVPELLARQQYEQRTPAWYEVRKGLMTASDAAGALGIPAFKGQRNVRQSLLEQKVSGTFTGNHMTRWGQDNEDQVRERAMQALGEVAWEVGLVVHPTLPWLGASPDGVTNTGRLIEIKCPYKRKPLPEEVPHHYWPQIQVQLECTDLDQCYFVQWQPAHLANDGLEVFSIAVVERDRRWFEENVDALKSFWGDLMNLRKDYVPPPPPQCSIALNMYSGNAGIKDDSSDEESILVVPSSKRKTRIIVSSSSESSESESEEADLKTLRKKLQDALEALDSWSSKHYKRV